MKTLSIINIKNPMTNNDGFDFTEDFDGKISINSNTVYFNFKFICDNGGAQIRSLREVYHFIHLQILYLQKNKYKKIYFINILDGDTSYKHYNKFNYLINESENDIKEYIYVGDMYSFSNHWKLLLNDLTIIHP